MSTDTTEAPVAKIAAADLVEEIRKRYEAPEWLVESEVTLAGRRLDVVAFRLWGGRTGHRIVGFETKISRGDWLRELADFRKSEEWMQVVDAFYVVTPPKLVKPEELPAGWGLLELTGSKMMTKAHALHKEPSATLPRELTGRMLMRMQDRVRDAERNAEWKARNQLREEIREQVVKDANRDADRLRVDLKELREWRDSVFAAFGIYAQGFGAEKTLARAAGLFAKMAEAGGDRMLRVSLEGHSKRTRETLAAVDSLLEELNAKEVGNAA